MSNDVFGEFLTGADVEAAVNDTLATWLPTYLRAVERNYDKPVGWLRPIASQVVVNEFAQFQDEPLPGLVIVCPGTEGDPERDGDGYYGWWWPVATAIIVEAVNDTAARRLAQFYAAALELLFTQKKSLGGFAGGFQLRSVDHDDAPPNFPRGGCAVASVEFAVFTQRVVTDLAGPTEPVDDPTPWPTVETVHIDAERLTA